MAATRTPRSHAPMDARRGHRGRRTLYFCATFFVGFLVFDALVGDRGVVALLHARQQHAQLVQEVADAKAENARLREEVDRLTSDPTAIEEVARRELGMIKPGEKLFIIHDVAAPRPQ